MIKVFNVFNIYNVKQRTSVSQKLLAIAAGK